MGVLANSEDPDEMSLDATFHQDLHCFYDKKQSSGKKMIFVGNMTCDPTIYTMDNLTQLH